MNRSSLLSPKRISLVLLVLMVGTSTVVAGDATEPIVREAVVFEEVDGTLAIEAEHFYKQTQSEVRAWHIISADSEPDATPDGDPPHLEDAARGAYIEALPDTRRTHGDRLIRGENFSPEPGQMAVLHYRAYFRTPGRYYVWARAFSTGTEDNGLHFGLNGQWPESGQRWQTVAKNSWHWDSKQRTQEVHTGVPFQLYLDVNQPGLHDIMVSMREDGFELDRIVLTTRREDGRPEGAGPEPRKRG